LDGAFDITVLPLKELWGLCEQCSGIEPLPDSNQVGAAIQYIDYGQVRVGHTGDSVFLKLPDIRIDIGGIAKGYVIRWLAELLKNSGVDNFIIAAGGDILASGRKHDNTPWRVGVQHPRNQSELITTILLENNALFTSGDYNRFRIMGGNRYHHIFDPSTGYSCGQNWSLTIRTNDPVRADILSTGLFCKNAEDILEFVRIRDDVECFIVDYNGNTHMSGGWATEN
jgi:thiamine biosynthesis lipoprotein